MALHCHRAPRQAFLSLCAVATLTLFVVCAGEHKPEDPIHGVEELTTATFDEVVGKDAAVLVEFYAPWCGHCKAMVEEMVKLGSTVASAGTTLVRIGKVDATAQADLVSRFKVEGYPTILYFAAHSTEPEKYTKERDAGTFLQFLNERAGAGLPMPQKERSTVVELSSRTFNSVVLDAKKHVLVKFFAPWCGHCKKIKPVYEQVAVAFDREDNVVIAEYDSSVKENQALAKEYDIKGIPSLKYFAAGDNKTAVDYTEARDLDAIVKFVNEVSGARRSTNGDLQPDAGLDDQLTALAKKLVGGTNAEQIISDMESRAQAIGTDVARMYVTAARRVVGDVGYATREVARINRVLNGSVAGKRRDQLMYRLNVLNCFIPTANAPKE